jgi:GTP-binding protein
MEIKKSEFIISCPSKATLPQTGLPEVSFVGRSNVGKSSLINTLTNRKKLARVSNTPGRTRLINYFLINEEMYFVDLPGYGYAKVSKEQRRSWGKIIEEYMLSSQNLKLVVMLVDSRHIPSEDDILMYNFIKHYNYKVLIAATKSDKLKKNDMSKNKKMIIDTLKLAEGDNLLFFSSLKREGKEELIDSIYDEVFIRGKNGANI